MEDSVFALLRRALAERQETLTEQITIGTAKDFAEYRYMVGALREVNLMQLALIELEQRYIDD